jgi:hypothetical protein
MRRPIAIAAALLFTACQNNAAPPPSPDAATPPPIWATIIADCGEPPAFQGWQVSIVNGQVCTSEGDYNRWNAWMRDLEAWQECVTTHP